MEFFLFGRFAISIRKIYLFSFSAKKLSTSQSNLFEVFRDRDHTKVGMIQGILEAYGIRTMMRNRNSVTMTTEIPIPDMFPNVCVFSHEDLKKSKQLLEIMGSETDVSRSDWTCVACGESNEGGFGECWSCQTPHPEASGFED
jgi:hypothetical protein